MLLEVNVWILRKWKKRVRDIIKKEKSSLGCTEKSVHLFLFPCGFEIVQAHSREKHFLLRGSVCVARFRSDKNVDCTLRAILG